MICSPVSMSLTARAHCPLAYSGLFITSIADWSRPGMEVIRAPEGAGELADDPAELLATVDPLADEAVDDGVDEAVDEATVSAPDVQAARPSDTTAAPMANPYNRRTVMSSLLFPTASRVRECRR